MSESKPTVPPNDEAYPGPLPAIDVRQLLQGRREIILEHDGVRYRLRLTRRNKLILQK
jgi:hemin uptake protein HemP